MKRWIIGTLVVLSLILWFALVWFAFPLIGFGDATPFDAVWVRILLIAVVWLTVGTVYLVKFLRRRKAAKALEEAITEQEITGDGEVLGEKMGEAMSVLKQSAGSKSFLYDLPWYIIIGPPGSGKTTALLNSGVKFPLAEKGEGAVAGVGGTRYCDWWFSEEAVLIDTAGRYTTQDSDAEADGKSWASFLKLLKTYRANQPINGVMLAISLQEIMTATPAEIEAHAEIIRSRLMEIHDELKVDFPVYVLFTKADLISGFMEFFGSFSQSRRQKVWGATFQTDSKKEQTVERFDEEYHALVNRLSEEVTDRLQEDPDAINRIAIFGFPGQVAMLQDRLGDFMRGVFGHTRYKVAANLRGFYFSSGTQEGTPIDQVLGSMQRNFGGMAQGQMSGKAKSFFLHDLLKKVIFAEAGWVSTDKRAVRRAAIWRYSAISVIVLATLGMLGLWGLSFMQNRELIGTAEAAISDYELSAQEEINTGKVEDIDLLTVLPHLEMLRNMPMGYAEAQLENDAPITEKFGLSQRGSVESAATATYRQALERMMRSRIILQLEQQLENFIRSGEVMAVYRTLKVYKLLGDLAPQSDDELIIAYFRDDWRRNTYQGTNPTTRQALEDHLVAMLELAAVQQPSFELNGALIDQSERLLARMNVEDQAYSLLLATAEFTDIEPFTIANRAGRDSDLVFEGVNGEALEELVISPLYTYRGFHEFFLPQLSQIAQNLLDDQWVMGEYAAEAQLEDQIAGLGPILLKRYVNDWIEEWDRVLGAVKLRPMSADKPSYQSLAAAAASRSSPILLLTEGIAAETSLTVEYTKADDEPPAGISGALEGKAGEAGGEFSKRAAQIFISRQQGLARVGLDVVFRKSQQRAGGSGGSGGPAPLPGAEIESYYADWHDLLIGDQPNRRIDLLLATLGDMQRTLITAVDFPEVADREMPANLGALKQASSRLPRPMERMIQEAVDDFEGDAANTSVARLNELLNSQVTQVCQAVIDSKFPFAQNSAREVGLVDFAKLFAPQGVMDRFFLENLSQFADINGTSWTWKESGPLAGKLSTSTLKQFERAAAIRDAFFPTGGGIPVVDMEVVPTSLHKAIETAQLQVNGQVVLTRRRGNSPAAISWPGSLAGGSTSLVFTPEMRGRKSDISEAGGWGFVRFLNAGQPKVSGNQIEVRYNIGGRHIAYRMTLATQKNPFFMNELTQFKCPQGL